MLRQKSSCYRSRSITRRLCLRLNPDQPVTQSPESRVMALGRVPRSLMRGAGNGIRDHRVSAPDLISRPGSEVKPDRALWGAWSLIRKERWEMGNEERRTAPGTSDVIRTDKEDWCSAERMKSRSCARGPTRPEGNRDAHTGPRCAWNLGSLKYLPLYTFLQYWKNVPICANR